MAAPPSPPPGNSTLSMAFDRYIVVINTFSEGGRQSLPFPFRLRCGRGAFGVHNLHT